MRRRVQQNGSMTRRPPSQLEESKQLAVKGQAKWKIEKMKASIGQTMPEVDNQMVFIKNEKMIFF